MKFALPCFVVAVLLALVLGRFDVARLPQVVQGDDALSVAFGDAKSTISAAMVHKADSYFHGGIDMECKEHHDHHDHDHDHDHDHSSNRSLGDCVIGGLGDCVIQSSNRSLGDCVIGELGDSVIQSSILQFLNPPIHQSSNPPIHQSTNPPILQSPNPPILQSPNRTRLTLGAGSINRSARRKSMCISKVRRALS